MKSLTVASLVPAATLARAAVPAGRRISADPHSPDYDPRVSQMAVTLDGFRVEYCVCADEARGEVVIFTVPQPRPMGAEFHTHIRRGVVKIYDDFRDVAHLPKAA